MCLTLYFWMDCHNENWESFLGNWGTNCTIFPFFCLLCVWVKFHLSLSCCVLKTVPKSPRGRLYVYFFWNSIWCFAEPPIVDLKLERKWSFLLLLLHNSPKTTKSALQWNLPLHDKNQYFLNKSYYNELP